MTHKKDILEKNLLAYNDVFADIINAVVPLEEPVNPDDLENAVVRTSYHQDIHEQERDVAKIWKKGKIKFCLLGLENQTEIDKTMTLRTFGYEGGDYREQITKRNDEIKKARKSGNESEAKRLRKEKFYPVVTIILYYGKRRWKTSTTLFECLNIPKGLEGFVNNIKLNIVEVAWLTDEQIGKFKGDFRIVADYFRQTRINKEYNPPKKLIEHVDTMLKLMRTLTNDLRFEQMQVALHEKYEEEEKVTMYDLLSRTMDKRVNERVNEIVNETVNEVIIKAVNERVNEALVESIAEAVIKARKEATDKALETVYRRLIEKQGFSPELAAEITNYSVQNNKNS